MRALVVGQGSIGRRHARVLSEMGLEVAVVTHHVGNAAPGMHCHPDIPTALNEQRPGYIVVANQTYRHHEALATLAEAGFDGVVLVEKPLFDRPRTMPPNRFRRLAVGYNLRFHPVLLELRRRLSGRTILAVEAYAGQWLPDWRPNVDYRVTYSARTVEGGGVLRDLSHELDLITWLFGPWCRLAALGGRRGRLEIDSDDLWTVMMELRSGAALTLQINYLDRPGRRRLLAITTDATFEADLSAATLRENGDLSRFEVARDDTYRAEHAALIAGRSNDLCSMAEGNEVLATIAAIEKAVIVGAFVARETVT